MNQSLKQFSLRLVLTLAFLLSMLHMNAQGSPENTKDGSLLGGLTATAELSGQAGSGDFAPLWLTSNRHGVASPYTNSGYERISAIRDFSSDSTRNWRRSYGLDLLFSQNAQSWFMLHQAFFELRYKKVGVYAGIKERDIDLRNNDLTSGELSMGTNAAPHPMIMFDADYFSIPFTNKWWKWRGRVGLGFTTDGKWQKSWVGRPDTMRYTGNTLYHEKALYWKFGREEIFPLTYEIGIQMGVTFGGTSYNISGRNSYDEHLPVVKHPTNAHAFWDAFWPMSGSSDVTDGTERNVAGNTFGSYNMALSWTQKTWSIRAYFERYFEDHSMITVQYGINDHLIGAEACLPRNRFLSNIVIEHLSTKIQSGPVYHDPTTSIPERISGRDNYYNHLIYTGRQHWGMAQGNPLLTSPIYNSDHELKFHNNRVMAWHLGLKGNPTDEISWKVMMSFSKNWGCYNVPFEDIYSQQYLMAGVGYAPNKLKGWSANINIGYDHGKVLGNNFGVQMSLKKTLRIK